LGISALFAGCETFAHREKREPTKEVKRVEVFHTNSKPPGKVRDLAVVTEEGKIEDEAEIEARFVKKARFAGADALIFDPITKVGEAVSLFSAPADLYLYKATIVAYK
jgi:hypothetical protein